MRYLQEPSVPKPPKQEINMFSLVAISIDGKPFESGIILKA